MPRFIKCNSVSKAGDARLPVIFDANKIVAVEPVDGRDLTNITILGDESGSFWIDLPFDVVTELLTPEEPQ